MSLVSLFLKPSKPVALSEEEKKRQEARKVQLKLTDKQRIREYYKGLDRPPIKPLF